MARRDRPPSRQHRRSGNPWAFAAGGLLLLSLAVTQLLRPWLRSTFGGVTGDVLGAVSSVLETAWLLLLALLAPYVALLQYLHHQLR